MIVAILLKYFLIGYIPYLFYNVLNKLYFSKNRITSITKNEIDNNKQYNKNRYTTSKVPKNIDVIVIGSGIGGLTFAALLAKSGKKVLVLEQHYLAGGTTHSFEDKGVEHETGVHYIGNIEKRKPILDLITHNPLEWCKLGWERDDGRFV